MSGEHLTVDELSTYAEGTSLARDRDRIRRHLEHCAECREVVKDLAAYPELEPPSDAYRIDDDEIRRSLGDLRARTLHGEDRDPAPVAPRPEPPPEPLPFTPPEARRPALSPGGDSRGGETWPWWLAAAALFLLTLGWGVERQLELERLTTPQANAEVVALLASDDPLRSGEALEPVFLTVNGTTIILEAEELLTTETGTFTAEIRNREEETVARIEGLEPRTAGIQFYLPPRALPPGEYRVWLRRDDGQDEPRSFELSVRE